MDIAALIKDFGFPIVAAVGLGYFVYYVWQTINNIIDDNYIPMLREFMENKDMKAFVNSISSDV